MPTSTTSARGKGRIGLPPRKAEAGPPGSAAAQPRWACRSALEACSKCDRKRPQVRERECVDSVDRRGTRVLRGRPRAAGAGEPVDIAGPDLGHVTYVMRYRDWVP